MANNSTVTKVLQVSEEAAPAVHIPVMVGNELFVLTQQDVRRVEDTRHMCYNRLTPNQFANGVLGHTSIQSTTAEQICALQNLVSHCQQNCPMNCEVAQQTETPHSFAANVTKQLNWSKTCKSSSPYPMKYSTATSTSGLEAPKCDHANKKGLQSRQHCSCQTSAETTSKACNTEPITNPEQWFKKHCSNDSLSESSCHTPQERFNCEYAEQQPSRTTPASSDCPHGQRRKSMVPPFCVVNEEHDAQQEHKR